MKVYVAGHRGLVGSAVVRALNVRGKDDLVVAPHNELDLTRQAETYRFLETQRPDAMVLAAARVGGIGGQLHDKMLHDNLAIAHNVIEGAKRIGCKRLVFLGSSCIYPREAAQPIVEDALLTGPLESTNRGYAIAKIAGLEMARAYAAAGLLDTVSLMPTNLYGPGDNYDLQRSHVLPALIRKFHEAKVSKTRAALWGSGSALREFLHVDDLARAVLLALDEKMGADPINVGSGEEVSIRTLAELVARVVEYEGRIEWDTRKPDGTPRKLLDSSKIRSFGWAPTIGLEAGIRSTYEAYLTRSTSGAPLVTMAVRTPGVPVAVDQPATPIADPTPSASALETPVATATVPTSVPMVVAPPVTPPARAPIIALTSLSPEPTLAGRQRACVASWRKGGCDRVIAFQSAAEIEKLGAWEGVEFVTVEPSKAWGGRYIPVMQPAQWAVAYAASEMQAKRDPGHILLINGDIMLECAPEMLRTLAQEAGAGLCWMSRHETDGSKCMGVDGFLMKAYNAAVVPRSDTMVFGKPHWDWLLPALFLESKLPVCSPQFRVLGHASHDARYSAADFARTAAEATRLLRGATPTYERFATKTRPLSLGPKGTVTSPKPPPPAPPKPTGASLAGPDAGRLHALGLDR